MASHPTARNGRLLAASYGWAISAMGVQDVKVIGIPLENAKAAIRMCRIRQKRILSPEELAVRLDRLAKARRVTEERGFPS
jgi:hypothetical protein